MGTDTTNLREIDELREENAALQGSFDMAQEEIAIMSERLSQWRKGYNSVSRDRYLARIAYLERVIAGAPHGLNCTGRMHWQDEGGVPMSKCDCFKSKANE